MSSGKKSGVLIIGGCGFIGASAVEQFLYNDRKVKVLDICVRDEIRLEGVEYIQGDASDESVLEYAAEGCDSVVYLAAQSLPSTSNSNLKLEIESHVIRTIRSAELFGRIGVKRFVYSSSGGTVYGNVGRPPYSEEDIVKPITGYGVSKLAIEGYLRIISSLRSMKVTSLRISNPYGIGQVSNKKQGFIGEALKCAFTGEVLEIWGDGSISRDFIYVGDVARAIVSACVVDDPPEIINIGSGRPASLLDILNIIKYDLGLQIKVKFSEKRNIDVKENYLDISLAKSKLNWSPMVSLKEGIGRTADWWESKFGR